MLAAARRIGPAEDFRARLGASRALFGSARADRALASHDGVELRGEPDAPLPAAGEDAQRIAPIGETVTLEQRPRGDQLLFPREREGRQEKIGPARHVPLGVALEIELRPVGLSIEQGGGRRHEENERIPGASFFRLFRFGQKTASARRIGKEAGDRVGPFFGILKQIRLDNRRLDVE